MKNRSLFDLLSARLEESSPLIQVVVGPRQVGKTTALKQALAGRGVYFSADYPAPLPVSTLEQLKLNLASLKIVI